jgi:hypothetical protein
MNKRYQVVLMPMAEPYQVVDYDPLRPGKVFDNYWLAWGEAQKWNQKPR